MFHGFRTHEENLVEISAADALVYLQHVRAEVAIYNSASSDPKRELVTANAFVHGEDLAAYQVVTTGTGPERDSCVVLMERCQWFRNIGHVHHFINGPDYGSEDIPVGFRSIQSYDDCNARCCVSANLNCAAWDGGYGQSYWDMYVEFIACFNPERGTLTVFCSTGSD